MDMKLVKEEILQIVEGFEEVPANLKTHLKKCGRQAEAELCQAQHSLGKLPTSSDLATNSLGWLSQPAVAGAGGLAELQHLLG